MLSVETSRRCFSEPGRAGCFSLAVEKAIETDAELVMASDPDADRVGAAVKNNEGEWVLLNGNQTALMFVYYLITRWKELGKINGKEYIVKQSLRQRRSRRSPSVMA